MSAYLYMPDGQMVPIRDGLLLGRVAGCDIVIDDTKASRKHACLRVEGGVVEIEDLGSSNGTLLNGKPVQRRLLRDGDEVRIGATVIVFRERAGAAPSVAAADDDVDLFGSDEPTAPAASAPPPPQLPPAAPPAAVAVPDRNLVEFADEVVAVRTPSLRPVPGTGRVAPASAAPMVEHKQRTLQFARTEARGGSFGDDLAQMSGGLRLLVAVLVLAGAAGLAWLVMTLVG